jgi:hypothetical protein
MKTMAFDPNGYGPLVASLLQGEDRLKSVLPARDTFPGARSPEGAMAGLYLYHDRIDEAHNIAQDLGTAEGSFWHGIVHRREPDPGNAAYWFRRVGRHPVYPVLRESVAAAVAQYPQSGFQLKPEWDPFAWIDFWQQAHRSEGSQAGRLAQEIQRMEWEVLFDWCVRPKS